MIVSLEVLSYQAIRPYRSDNHGSLLGSVSPSHGGERVHFVGCSVAIEREAIGPAQDDTLHGLTEQLPYRRIHSRPGRCTEIRFKTVGVMRETVA